MSQELASNRAAQAQHVDVLIVGAGISGISAAYHVHSQCQDKSYLILESQHSFGGTWLTHTYPGIRSDSDLFTFGYKFKPWTGAPIASGEEILKYMREVIDENAIGENIRFDHVVKSASWSSQDKLWTLSAENKDSGETLQLTCNFLWMCQGYYRHSEGYTPDFKGMEDFRGEIIHPQTWPEDLDYKNKKVVVIGSGATAATVIPAIADECEHVTMLQRSPTYFIPLPNHNEVADMLRELEVPDDWTHEIVRRKILHDQNVITRRSFEEPEVLKAELVGAARAFLGPGFDVETHFTPRYRPWSQRIAIIPEGDLFLRINTGQASVVTDQIDHFTETGIKLRSGKELEADIIVTATGFNLCVLGDIDFVIDDKPLNFADTWTYRGIMYSGIPNMAWVFGYLRTSWTMRSDLISEFVCRLLNHMDENNVSVCTPQLRSDEADMPAHPFIEPDNFNPGYLSRSMHLMPKQGDRAPWIFAQDYHLEKDEIPTCDLEDGALIYRA